MKRNFTRFPFFLTLLLPALLPAQCPGGYSQAQLNWDNIDFLPSNNVRYTSFYPTAAFPYTQKFAIGTRTVSFTMSNANLALDGENATNTADAGSFAAPGDDVQFTTSSGAASIINMNFDADVANLRFSIYDLDNSQRVNITAINAAAVAQTITIAKANAGSAIGIAGSGSTSATATGPGSNYVNTDNNGTVNITIAGPVKQIIVTLSGSAGDAWLSDLNACVTGSFPVGYQKISRPFTGQPQYVLTVVNNNIYYVDPTNGKAYFLFNEPAHNRLNSMAYDPYKRVVYYTFSLTGGSTPQTDKVLRKYDVDTKTISIVSNNVNNLGIPTYESGVESGAATFYNGSLYLGVEGYTGTSGGGSYAASRKSTIWKIDFDAAGNPVGQAAQVWGVLSDDGVNSQNIHDWSDFGISDGMLYDFDGSQSGDIDYYHFNMMTGTNLNYIPSDGVIPRQVSIGWDEKLYNVDATLGMYNGTDRTGTQFTIAAPLGPVIPTGGAASWGDAAGPYRPFLDFGDAPATYDPIALSPACHDTLTPTVTGKRTKLILGPNEDVEWLKRGFTTVEDNFEDGLAFVPIFTPPSGTYTARVTVKNTIGANATVCAWLDFNGNGQFDAAEGITPVTVTNSPLNQLITLNWPTAPSTLPNGSFTYLRIRITAASYNMTAANATGYYDMGEVEDYRVVIDYMPLATKMISFDAKAVNDEVVDLDWTATEEANLDGYTIQRSKNGTNWENIGFVAAQMNGGLQEYNFRDNGAPVGRSYYRLRMDETGASDKFSVTRNVDLRKSKEKLLLSPNPAVTAIHLKLSDAQKGNVEVRIADLTGKTIYQKKYELTGGTNSIDVLLDAAWPAGTYILNMEDKEGVLTKKFVIRR